MWTDIVYLILQINTTYFPKISQTTENEDCCSHPAAIPESKKLNVEVSHEKFKKMMSVTLAGCMAASALMMSAGAVDMNSTVALNDTPAAVSTYAGETVTCDVYVAKADGSMVEKSIDINIPADASESKAERLIEANARAVATQNIDAPRSYGSQIIASGKGRVLRLVSSGNGSVLANVTLDDHDYYMMGVFFTDVSPFVTSLNCSVMDTNIGTTQQYFLNIKPNSNRKCEALFLEGDSTDGQKMFNLYSGQNLNFFGSCKTSNGSDGIADVTIRGYYS